MSNYTKGTGIENRIIKFLESCGYCAVRSAGSKGAFDVVAYNEKIIRFIQSKYTSDPNRSYTSDIKKMEAVKVPSNATKELWIYESNRGFTKCVFLTGVRGAIHIPDKARLVFYDLEKLRKGKGI